ncbi:cleavage stimulation factor subunit 2 isoform X2 [Protopterus annectens]|uniref:cleavage stimulation factor subunit 2 isoform X2 n=1 Tax=Protopterus annectens TaxID=7888 RepID=UPI001CFBA392|nr:cleavage stimulation factor subunit 2 isoform X2 [Protopterus annectens]
MANLMTRDPAVDRSLRSVFVGNIPYEATEEQLKDIFSEVGPVVSFRLVYDRETGKPKGYGFCEYQDQETALSAMRNLNGREFSGRALRVDNAASEKNKEELKSLGTGAPVIESPYGDHVPAEDAPESISRAVASLPPEQMFELMKQMKLCVQNSPQEARNMLLQNPQLAYALLQAQVVMRIVDPEIAMKMLHRPVNVQPVGSNNQPGPGSNAPMNQPPPPGPQPQPMSANLVSHSPPMLQFLPSQGGIPAPLGNPTPLNGRGVMPSQMGNPPSGPGPMPRGQGSMQLSPLGPAGPGLLERSQVPLTDPRASMQRGPAVSGVPPPRGLLGDGPNDPRGGTLHAVTSDVDPPNRFLGAPHPGPPLHHIPPHDNRGPPAHELRGGPMESRGMIEPRGPLLDQRGPPLDTRAGRDPRSMDARNMESRVPVPAPRVTMPGGGGGGIPNQGPIPMSSSGPQVPRPAPSLQVNSQGGGFSPAQNQVTPQDHEKAALIMQVLQLTPDQIAMLPPEQRQSILILKEQIQKSTGAS